MSKEKKESQGTPITDPEEIARRDHEYKVLKARGEWMKMNQKFLDDVERKRLFHVRLAIFLCVFNLVVSLLNWLL